MLNPDNLSIVSQMPGQHEFVEGIYEAPTYIVGIDKALGLMAISSSTSSLDTSPAKLAMDVLMDDMRTNIPMLAKAKTESKVAAMAVNCLQESLSNINEYLCSQVGKQYDSTAVVATHLSAFQYLNGLMSYVLGAGVRAFIIRNNNIKELSNAYSHLSGALGESTMIESHVETTTLIAGDILFIASSDDISIIEEDFIRITLSRFPDSLETALRQINTRVARKATSQAPGIILCRVMQNTVLKRSWVGKFKKP